MTTRRGFLGGIVAAAFAPAAAVAAQFTIPVVESSSVLQDRLRRKTIEALGLNPDTIDQGFNTEFSLARCSLDMQQQRYDHMRGQLQSQHEQLVAQIHDTVFSCWKNSAIKVVV